MSGKKHLPQRVVLGRVAIAAVCLVSLLGVSACGGGGGSDETAASPSSTLNASAGVSGRLSGTAATGAAIANATVTLKDAQGKLFTATTDAAGRYALDMKNLHLPGVLRVGALHAPVTAEDLGQTLNINPLTDLALAHLAEQLSSSYYDKGDFSGLSKAKVDAALSLVQAKLRALLDVAGVQAQDFLRTAFVANHAGADRVLDVLSVSYEAAGAAATIMNRWDGQRLRDPLAANAQDGVVLSFVDADIWPALFSGNQVIAERSAAVQQLVKRLNEALVSGVANGTADLSWCDQASFLDSNYRSCADWFAALRELADGGRNPLVLKRVIAFDTGEVDNVNTASTDKGEIGDGNFGAVIRFKREYRTADMPATKLSLVNGAWTLSGDQRLVSLSVRGFVSKGWVVMFSNQPNYEQLGYGVVVSTKTADITKVDQIHVEGLGGFDRWEFYGDQYPIVREIFTPTIYGDGAPPRDRVVYTITAKKGDQEVARYKVRLLSDGIPSQESVADIAFPELKAHPDVASCEQGNPQVSWTLPQGYSGVYLHVACSNQGGSDGEVYGMAEKDLTSDALALSASMSLNRQVPRTDVAGMTVKALAPNGVLVTRFHGYDLASSGVYVSAGISVDARAIFNSGLVGSRGQLDQAWLDNFNDTFNANAAFKQVGDGVISQLVCKDDESLEWANIQKGVAITVWTDFSVLNGQRFRNVSCMAGADEHAMSVTADGTVTLSSRSLGKGIDLKTSVFQPGDQTLTMAELGKPNADGAITWLRPIQAMWQDVTEYFVMEVTTWPETQQRFVSFWRRLTED